MKHEEPAPFSREDAAIEFASRDRDRISKALVRLALNDEDRARLESLLIQYTRHDDEWVRGVAATCLGHVARLFREIDLDAVLSALNRLRAEPATAGRAGDALSDIDIFVFDHRGR